MRRASLVALAAITLIAGTASVGSQAHAAPQGRGGAPPETGRGGRAGAPPDQGAAAARGRGAAAAPTFDYGWKSEEYLLLGDANRGAGEPMIAVDPTNPKHIIVVAMASLQQVPPGSPARGQLGRSTITTLAVTHDGGITWKLGELPILYNDTLRCPDPIADVTKDGHFLAGCEIRQTRPDAGTEGSYVMISTDKGETWGPRVEFIGWNTKPFAPGLNPRVGGAQPYDRPYLAIDDTTGVIYGVAQGGTANTTPGQTKPQAYITASTDGGKSFGTIYAWDMNGTDYPQIGRGAGQAAGHGEVAVLYTASSVPAREQAGACPCPVVGISRDLGKTFTYRLVKGLAAGAPGTNTSPAVTDLAIDPTKAGRFSVLAYTAAPTPRYDVVTSEDRGQTWSPAVVAGTTPNATSFTKPVIKYSRQAGVLGVVWRAIYRDGTYDIWSAISKDAGKTFSRPFRVSHAVSPALDPIRVGANDDIQDLAMDAENIHMVWGDSRAGFQGTFYGRVPFSAFEFVR